MYLKNIRFSTHIEGEYLKVRVHCNGVICIHFLTLPERGGGAIRMRIYASFETLDFSHSFLHCVLNSVLYQWCNQKFCSEGGGVNKFS